MSVISCTVQQKKEPEPVEKNDKIVVYQVFTRLFGNTNTTNKPWGTIEENGVGKFNDFTDVALSEIKNLGVTHIWYTGVPHHAVINDYTAFGISNDDPDVVKGRAGSPYAVKDYYNVNPDLAVEPANRLEEFKALIERSHRNGLKVIIDIVPNHVARNYQSLTKPNGVTDFGRNDDKSVEYKRNNNFYYIPGESFKVPDFSSGEFPLGGEKHPLADGKFDENPAKWTGNGARAVQPSVYDWYETVKINYGVQPDGTKDFEELTADFDTASIVSHFNFWKDKNVPDSWIKFRDIAIYWLEIGVDGFRFDMAEMVPVEFWSYLNSQIKIKNPEAVLIAEVYNPTLYRDYIRRGKMDFLYDKVGFYDSLRVIMQGKGNTGELVKIQSQMSDIEHHMLHFLENHDEQRIASTGFAGNAQPGKPGMLVSATISTSPTLIYFAQELGESASENAGFGKATRTTIFDYFGVPSLQRWMNNGMFDGGQLTTEEKELRDFYQRMLNLTISEPAFSGKYFDLHSANIENTVGYSNRIISYARYSDSQKLIVAVSFDKENKTTFSLKIPAELIREWKLKPGSLSVTDLLYGNVQTELMINEKGTGTIEIELSPLGSVILQLQK
ncbi:MAG: alpha-amylase [Bacteroidetes bacterium]|nr:MAG: alpha-amylase [Bacteroidota bacterium]